MSEDPTPPPRPVFRSANPYSSIVDAEEAEALAPGAGRPVFTWLPPGVEEAPPTRTPPPAPPMPAARPAPRPPARPRVGTATVAVTLVVAGLLSVGVGALLARATSRSAPPPAALKAPAAGGPNLAAGSSSEAAPASATPAPSPAAPPMSLADIEARVDPATVAITATIPDQDVIAEGTGMIIDASGEVLTNDHVVDGASRISLVIGGRGKTYRAHLVGADRNQDVAVLQIDQAPSGLATVAVGDTSSVALGDHIVVLGNAGGRAGKPVAATGTVSGLDQSVTATDANGANAETLTGLIQVDARVQPGDSGGPLVDDQARVIGMDTAASGRHASTPQGYAIPIGTAIDVASQIAGGAPSG